MAKKKGIDAWKSARELAPGRAVKESTATTMAEWNKEEDRGSGIEVARGWVSRIRKQSDWVVEVGREPCEGTVEGKPKAPGRKQENAVRQESRRGREGSTASAMPAPAPEGRSAQRSEENSGLGCDSYDEVYERIRAAFDAEEVEATKKRSKRERTVEERYREAVERIKVAAIPSGLVEACRPPPPQVHHQGPARTVGAGRADVEERIGGEKPEPETKDPKSVGQVGEEAKHPILGPPPVYGPIFVAVDYVTAATLSETTGRQSVCAFESGNLKAVTEALRGKYPELVMIVAADDERCKGTTESLEQARAAAEAVGGTVISPPFTAEERARGLTNFNDLALARGREVVHQAIEPVLEWAQVQARREQQKTQECDFDMEERRKGQEKAREMGRDSGMEM